MTSQSETTPELVKLIYVLFMGNNPVLPFWKGFGKIHRAALATSPQQEPSRFTLESTKGLTKFA